MINDYLLAGAVSLMSPAVCQALGIRANAISSGRKIMQDLELGSEGVRGEVEGVKGQAEGGRRKAEGAQVSKQERICGDPLSSILHLPTPSHYALHVHFFIDATIRRFRSGR